MCQLELERRWLVNSFWLLLFDLLVCSCMKLHQINTSLFPSLSIPSLPTPSPFYYCPSMSIARSSVIQLSELLQGLVLILFPSCSHLVPILFPSCSRLVPIISDLCPSPYLYMIYFLSSHPLSSIFIATIHHPPLVLSFHLPQYRLDSTCPTNTPTAASPLGTERGIVVFVISHCSRCSHASLSSFCHS